MTATPNHALRTATLAFSYRCAAVRSTGSVTAYAPAMKPGIRRAFALRRRAHTRALGSRSLSLDSLGDSRNLPGRTNRLDVHARIPILQAGG